jgi:hypothetical protein
MVQITIDDSVFYSAVQNEELSDVLKPTYRLIIDIAKTLQDNPTLLPTMLKSIEGQYLAGTGNRMQKGALLRIAEGHGVRDVIMQKHLANYAMFVYSQK